MTKGTVNVKTGNTEVAKLSPKAERGVQIRDMIQARIDDVKKLLPSIITPERFSQMVFTTIAGNDKLLMSTANSLIGSMLVAAQLGLEPNGTLGKAYIIPYMNKKIGQYEATFQIGYQGLIDLAYRSGQLKRLDAMVVHENDMLDYWFGLDPDIKHKPNLKDPGEVIAVYATYELMTGGKGFGIMSKAEVEKHRRQFSKAADSDPWRYSWEEMAKKTVLKKTMKYLPMSTEFIKAAAMDEQRIVIDDSDFGGEKIYAIHPDVEAMDVDSEVVEEPKAAPKKSSKKEEAEPIVEITDEEIIDEIMVGAPDFLKDTE